MKYNIKKEFDDELKHIKGLMNESYNSFLIPMISEFSFTCTKILNSQKVILFLHNKEIDHLYSLSLSNEN